MFKYNSLTKDQYVDLLVDLISSAEGLRDHASFPPKDKKATIGYGYTFNRNDNVAIWTAAGINLTASELATLKAIDAASPSNRDALAVNTFTHVLSKSEAMALLRQTYLQYEAPANGLLMPPSSEKAALVAITYNRGVGIVNNWTAFNTAIFTVNRAEAWYQIRYNSWGKNLDTTNVPGIRAARLVEAEVFGLSDPGKMGVEEAKNIYQMFTLHRTQILNDESLWGINPDGTAGKRNLIDEVNSDSRWSTLPEVSTITEALQKAENVLVQELGEKYSILSSLNIQDYRSTDIYLNPQRASSADTIAASYAARLDASKSTTNSILIGGVGNDTLKGGAGNDILIAGTGNDSLVAGGGNDTLIGGTGTNTMVGHKGSTDTFVFSGVAAGAEIDIINANGSNGVIYAGSQKLGETVIAATSTADIWRDADGRLYQYNKADRTLVITQGTLGSKIIVNDFDLAKAFGKDGYLGLHLAVPDKVAGRTIAEMPTNPFNDSSFNLDTAPTPTSTVKDGGMGTYAVFLPYVASGAGQQIKFQLSGDSASALRVRAGNQLITPQNGEFTLTVRSGTREVTFTLVAEGDVTGAEIVQVNATLIDPSGQTTYQTHTLEVITVDAKANAPQTIIDVLGGYKPKNFGTDDSPVYQKDDLGNYILDTTQPSGITDTDTLHGGDQNVHVIGGQNRDIIVVGAGADVIEGHGGNDNIYGGTGNSQIYADTKVSMADAINNMAAATGKKGSWIDGGTGDSLIIGSANNDVLMGNGNDTIIAGNGDNFIMGHTDWFPGDADWSVTKQYDGQTWKYVFNPAADLSVPSSNTSDAIYAGNGNNWISTGDGDNYVSAGNGNNMIIGGAGDNNIVVGDGDNAIFATFTQKQATNLSDDYIETGNGNNEIIAGGGDNTVIVGTGNNTIHGYAGNDYIEVRGGQGSNDIDVGGGDNTIISADGNDSIWADDGDNYVETGNGNSQVALGDGDNMVFTGNGADLIQVGNGNNYIDVGNGNDGISVGNGNNTLFVGDGNDSILAGNGTNYIEVGDGNDYIEVGNGNNTIITGNGNDTIYAGDGIVTVQAGAGNNLIYGGAGTDVLYAGDGGTSASPTKVFAGSGNTTIYGGAGVDELHTGSGNDVVYAGSGDTTIYGGTGNNTLYGGDGNSTIYASDGAAEVHGGNGSAVIYGGSGTGTLMAGTGMTTFVLQPGMGSYTIIGNDVATSSVQLGAGMKFSDLVSYRQGNDLVIGLQGAASRMTVQDYYSSPDNWTIQDNDGNAATGQELVAATTEAQVVNQLEAQFQAKAENDLIARLQRDGYVKQADGSWYRMPTAYGQLSGSQTINTQTFTYSAKLSDSTSPGQIYRISSTQESWSVSAITMEDSTWTIAHNSIAGNDQIVSIPSSQYSDDYAGAYWFSVSWVPDGYSWQDYWQNPVSGYINPDGSFSFSQSAGAVPASGVTESNNLYREMRLTVNSTIGDSAASDSVLQPWQQKTGALPSSLAMQFYHETRSNSFNSIDLGPGDHTVEGGYSSDSFNTVVNAGSGNNVFNGYEGFIYTGSGNDTIEYAHVVYEGSGDNIIYRADTVYGGSGNNVIYELYSAYYGGSGNDRIVDNYGGTVYCGSGNDTVFSDWGTAYGGSGNQLMTGSGTMVAGSGNDTIFGTNGENVIIDPNTIGNDLIGAVNNDSWYVLDTFYRSQGIDNWQSRYTSAGMYSDSNGYTYTPEYIASNAQAYWSYWQGITYQQALDQGLITYNAPLPVLAEVSGSYYAPSSYYATADIPKVTITADDYADLSPLYKAGLLTPTNTVTFQQGLAPSDLHLSWGHIKTSTEWYGWNRQLYKPGTYTTLNLSWGTDQSVRIILPNSSDPVGSGIQEFSFADGTKLTMGELIALAKQQSQQTVDLLKGDGQVAFSVEGIISFKFGAGLSSSDITATRSGKDLFLSDGNDQWQLTDYYADLANTSAFSAQFSDGTSMNYIDDGYGDTATASFDDNGIKIKDNWAKADGSYGTDIFNGDGSSSGRTVNTDGSSSSYVNDGHGHITATQFDSNGVNIGYSIGVNDGQGITTTTRFDNNSVEIGYSISIDDGQGNATVTQFSSSGAKLSDSWARSDGSHGTDTFNTDGSSTSYADNGHGEITTTQFDSNGIKTSYSIRLIDAQGNSTTTQFDGNGVELGYSTYVNDGQGDITTTYYDGSGREVSDSWSQSWSYSGYTYSSWGTDSYSYDANGNRISNSWTYADSDAYTESGIDSYQYIDNDTITSGNWSASDGGHGTYMYSNYHGSSWDRFNADGSGNGGAVDTDGSLSNYTNDGHGNVQTDFWDKNFVHIGDSWTTSDGRQGVNTAGNHLVLATAGNDTIDGNAGNAITVGGGGNDTVTMGIGSTVIAFDQGDGQDTVMANTGQNNTLSLGGHFTYADLMLKKSGNDMVLDIGTTDSITFQDWYASPEKRDLKNLQLVVESMANYAPASSDTLANAKVAVFDFRTVTAEFDQARAADPTLNSWSISNALLDAHLASSDTAALGGDLAYEYAMRGNLTGMNVTAAQATLSGSQFGTAMQTLQPWQNINGGLVQLK